MTRSASRGGVMDESQFAAEQVGWITLALISLGVAVTYALRRLRALRPLMDVKADAVQKLERTGVVGERLSEAHWNAMFRTTLERARQGFERADDEVSRAVALALADAEKEGGGLAGVVRRAALRAIAGGDIGSVLVRLDPDLLVYALAIPARVDDPRALKRCAALAEGWPAHAEALRRAVSSTNEPRLLGLAYCLDPEAREGTLAVAYEEAGYRVVTSPLADEAGAASEPSGRYDFVLASAG
jgi:hypothetical protein